MMHFHRKSARITCSNGIKVLLLLLITYATSASSSGLTQEEIADAIKEANVISDGPNMYCGKRLTSAMKVYCQPHVKAAILRGSPNPVKKSYPTTDLDFETFDLEHIAESYDDEILRSRYKTDDTYYANDIPFMLAQGNRRRRRGIIDECCKRACYKNELVLYCPNRG